MPSCFRIFLLFVVSLVITRLACAQPITPNKEHPSLPAVRLAISLDPPQDNNAAVISPTLNILKKHFGESNLQVIALKLPDLERSLENGDIDIFLSTSGLSRRMAQKGARDLVTLVSDRFPNPNKAYGSLFIARADSGIKTLQDMKGRKLAANMPGGFYGYQIAMGHLIDNGYEPNSFFSQVHFLGRDLRSIVQAVMNGQADVGVLSSCFLEDTFSPDSIERQSLAGVALVSAPGPCLRSTALYPNWAVSTMPSTPAEISKQVAQVLLNMPSTTGGLHWSVATDFSLTDALFKKLQLGPFDYLKDWFIKEFLRSYWHIIVAVIALVITLCAHSLLMRQVVQRRTQALRLALDREITLKKQTQKANDTVNALQKAFVINQFGSVIAHELRQPLATILAFVHGTRRYLEQDKLNANDLGEILGKIQLQAQRAEAVIDRVRAYAKNQQVQKSNLNLSQLLASVCSEFQTSDQYPSKLLLTIEPDIFVLGSTVELRLAIANLLRNANEALTNTKTLKPKIEVSLSSTASHASLHIRDNGPKLTDQQVEQMRTPLSSTKLQGLGLGLSIVEGIVKSHGGHMTLTPNRPGGLSVSIALPLLGIHHAS